MKSEEITSFKVTSDIVSWFDDVMISFLQNFGAQKLLNCMLLAKFFKKF